MKSILFVLLLLLVITPAFAQLSDRTGLVNRLEVKTGGHSFEVQTVSNFDISNYEFDDDQKRLTLYITSGLENNLGELYIPQTLLSGNFTLYINGEEYHPTVKTNNQISFMTLNFTGSGDNKIEIIGTNYLHGINQNIIDEPSIEEIDNGGGCLIATAAYGSELAPQLQQLREIRDNQLLKTKSGQLFMNSFNEVYYSFSPVIADYERENPIFKELVKITITPMISSLSVLSLSDDSEFMIVGLGLSVILLNIGMYFVVPTIVIVKLKKKF
ncbi:hypothetical protein YTPLAS73_08800 [Nitrosarchaeum sp.]|nr:hypothetical protein YTPLAS73_08800 [Nitrosarchaeum sp.]